MTKYRCEKHGYYAIDLSRTIEGYVCPRILCDLCEIESYRERPSERPKNIWYFYEEEKAVFLVEAHRGSAVWRFDPPVVHPEFTFGPDLKPILPPGARTSAQIMEEMEALLPQIEEYAKRLNVLELENLAIVPNVNSKQNVN